jgi:hypothetical protein
VTEGAGGPVEQPSELGVGRWVQEIGRRWHGW